MPLLNCKKADAGADISSPTDGAMITTDKFPYQIKGNFLDGSNMKIDTSISSQYLSALLLIAPQCLGE